MTEVTLSLASYDFGPLVLATKTIVGLVGAKFALGVAVSLRARTFDVQYLPNFILDDLLPALIAVAIMAVGILTDSSTLTGVGLLGVAAASAPLLVGIKDSFFILFGVKLPDPPPA